jgi:CyaY protein
MRPVRPEPPATLTLRMPFMRTILSRPCNPTRSRDAEYHQRASAALAPWIEAHRDRWLQDDVIDIDSQRTGGLLELSFPGGSKIVVNTQPPLHELWLAARAGGYHFRWAGGLARHARRQRVLRPLSVRRGQPPRRARRSTSALSAGTGRGCCCARPRSAGPEACPLQAQGRDAPAVGILVVGPVAADVHHALGRPGLLRPARP